MKKIILLLLGVVLLSSCENFLGVYSYTTYDSSIFPKRTEDLNDMLTGVYASMNRYMIQSNGESTYFMISELLCDDRFAVVAEMISIRRHTTICWQQHVNTCNICGNTVTGALRVLTSFWKKWKI